jgi:hypothetical protein
MRKRALSEAVYRFNQGVLNFPILIRFHGKRVGADLI